MYEYRHMNNYTLPEQNENTTFICAKKEHITQYFVYNIYTYICTVVVVYTHVNRDVKKLDFLPQTHKKVPSNKPMLLAHAPSSLFTVCKK